MVILRPLSITEPEMTISELEKGNSISAKREAGSENGPRESIVNMPVMTSTENSDGATMAYPFLLHVTPREPPTNFVT